MFFECEHSTIDKPLVITEPVAPSAQLLGLSSKLYPNIAQRMPNNYLTRFNQSLSQVRQKIERKIGSADSRVLTGEIKSCDSYLTSADWVIGYPLYSIHNWLRTFYNPRNVRLEQGEYPVKHPVMCSDLFHYATGKGDEHFIAQPVRTLPNCQISPQYNRTIKSPLACQIHDYLGNQVTNSVPNISANSLRQYRRKKQLRILVRLQFGWRKCGVALCSSSKFSCRRRDVGWNEFWYLFIRYLSV